MTDTPQTWHYGLVARFWAQIIEQDDYGANHSDCFRRVIAAAGEPILDAGCGAGRLLLPWLRDGLDVDGCDLSQDMLTHCRARAEADGLSPNLYQQALHEIDLPRRYRTIVMCGAIGLGGNRRRDQEALHRCYRHLEPGGVLTLDNDVPWAGENRWGQWRQEGREQLPEDWPPAPAAEDRRQFPDGSPYEMCARTVSFDPLSQVVSLQMRVREFRDDKLVEEEIYPLQTRIYFRDELIDMLEQAGFERIEVYGDYTDKPATADDNVHVFICHRAS
jgi:SAM-dependent methyltransferase